MNALWKPMASVPKETIVLVMLEEKSTGSLFHTYKKVKIINGYMTYIGGHFGFDMPKCLCWTELPDGPNEEQLERIKEFDNKGSGNGI